MLQRLWVVLLAISLLAGCGRGGKAQQEAQVRGVVEEYVTAIAQREYSHALSLTTGDAAAALEQLIPVLQALEYSSALSELETRVLELDTDRAEVEATYTQEQTIPDLGTSLTQYRLRYWLAPVGGQWKIYRVATVAKTAQRSE